MIAYTRLRDDILALRFGPKQALVEADIAEMLEMSKTPVREALQMLRNDGLVELNNFKGGRVRDLTAQDVHEIYELRAELEPLALRLSHPNSTSDDYDALREILGAAGRCAEVGDRVELASRNRAFHFALGARCGNERLLTILRQFADQVRLISLRSWGLSPTYGQEAQEHAAILSAVADDDDVERAALLLQAHIRRFADRDGASSIRP